MKPKHIRVFRLRLPSGYVPNPNIYLELNGRQYELTPEKREELLKKLSNPQQMRDAILQDLGQYS